LSESKSEIILKIDFEKSSSPADVFAIATDLVRSFEEFDRAILGSINSKIKSKMVLEDVEIGSLKVFLRNVLVGLEDDAVKSLDWKQQVGKYALKAKYKAIKWLDQKIEEDEKPKLADLTEEIGKLAEETDVNYLPDYAPIKQSRLAQSLDIFQRAKQKLKENETITITLDESEYRVKTRGEWMPSTFAEPDSEQELHNESDLLLVIKKPDFLGNSRWEFRHGKSYIRAAIEDDEWLSRFQQGQFPVKPGDALKVRVIFINKYDKNGKLIEAISKITKVYGVINRPSSETGDLF